MARPMVRSRLGYLPDLVAVNATNGASGYYRVSDLEIPKTPEEVPAYLEKCREAG